MNNKEVAQKVVDRMLETIRAEQVLPWTKPWSYGTGERRVQVVDGYTEIEVPVNYWGRSGAAYHGVNVLTLRLFGRPGEYITFAQAKKEGGKVRKGAKGLPIVYWSMIKKETGEVDDHGDPIIRTIPLLKYYTVFHLSDVEGLEQKHQPEPEVIRVPQWHYETIDGGIDPTNYDPAAEAIIADYLRRAQTLRLECGAESDRAYYSPAFDRVVVPNITQFAQTGEYYSTLFHELGHSTGHASRLNRFTGAGAIAAWGDENYSREELVAEITAASILSTLGLESTESFRNSAAYIKGWSEHIQKDPMMFITAAGKAEKAYDLIMGTAA